MSKPPRFFIDPSRVAGSTVTITGEDVRHIRTVLRKQPGDLLTLLDGRGAQYTVRITELGRAAVATEIVEQSRRERTGPLVTLCQGIPKSDKMDWIVQKATELGVSSIVPVMTERTVVKMRDEEKRVGRWQKIAREAAMQCGRPDIPAVERPQQFSDLLWSLAPREKSLFLLPWEEGTEPVKGVLRQRTDATNIVVLVGPEGGFSREEAGRAKERGFRPVSLGPNILRTETAAVAVLSMVLYELGTR